MRYLSIPLTSPRDYQCGLGTLSADSLAKCHLRDKRQSLTLRLLLTLFFYNLLLITLYATDISGVISSNLTLTKALSPYIVKGNILVNSSIILTIERGVQIRFDGNYGFLINGSLIAEGTLTDSIIFTSNKATQQAGDWNSIQFSSSASGAQFDGKRKLSKWKYP